MNIHYPQLRGPSRQQPLVVLAGWMGSHPKQLKRHRSLYERLLAAKTGKVAYSVTERITTPPMVIDTVLYPQPLRVPQQWPDHFAVPARSTRIQDLAWETLQHVHQAHCSQWIMHIFSNGGCFLWEEMRRILGAGITTSSRDASNITTGPGGGTAPVPPLVTSGSSPSLRLHHDSTTILDATERQLEALQVVQNRLAGVVFDSCPSGDLRLFPQALAYCSWTDRTKLWLLGEGGWDYYWWNTPRVQEKIVKRSSLYWDGLRDDPWPMPQLYLYSRADHLSPYAAIDELVQYRQKEFGTDLIHYKRWDSSPHCAHYKVHPEEYTEAISAFLQRHLTSTEEVQPSKL